MHVVNASITFGMGLNCPNLRRVIHWSPPGDIESYIQETGRAERGELPSTAELCVTTPIVTYVNVDMRAYCMNKTFVEVFNFKTLMVTFLVIKFHVRVMIFVLINVNVKIS